MPFDSNPNETDVVWEALYGVPEICFLLSAFWILNSEFWIVLVLARQ